ncbi:lytic transglycosylase domain-containing protein [Stenotrophomonas sp. YIM B06876]|uniref:lytic transglycosylase domain-containing protein n=1 Tax=Stenotrophomonas sp. YIM B06876 TaxID=3060211 RepID=UPI00273A570A|nr:lytic transglycosylase domain-containing protein [Stenotrophomonas sp. YIM B06876]
MSRRRLAWALGLVLGSCLGTSAAAQTLSAGPGLGQNLAALASLPIDPASLPAPTIRNGQEIFANFREGLAAPQCDTDAASAQWHKQFAHAPTRLGNVDEDVLPLFGYVVDELRKASLPTEFALIPFIESGYRPGARSASGPAGLWQFIASTARSHRVPMEAGYDGRLSAVDSTQAAVRYLKTLHGMFGGDWRLAVMAYNAGEYRVLQSLRRGGMNAQNARPAELPGLSPITYAYVEKLHALACVLEQAETENGLMASLDRPVPILRGHSLPAGTTLNRWAEQRSLDPARIARLNPAVAGAHPGARVLAPASPAFLPADVASGSLAAAPITASSTAPAVAAAGTRASGGRRHTVRIGESAWSIARRYGIPVKALLAGNNLGPASVLKPGMELSFEDTR